MVRDNGGGSRSRCDGGAQSSRAAPILRIAPASDWAAQIVAPNKYFDCDPLLLAQSYFSPRLKYFCFARPLSPSCNIGGLASNQSERWQREGFVSAVYLACLRGYCNQLIASMLSCPKYNLWLNCNNQKKDDKAVKLLFVCDAPRRYAHHHKSIRVERVTSRLRTFSFRRDQVGSGFGRGCLRQSSRGARERDLPRQASGAIKVQQRTGLVRSDNGMGMT